MKSISISSTLAPGKGRFLGDDGGSFSLHDNAVSGSASQRSKENLKGGELGDDENRSTVTGESPRDIWLNSKAGLTDTISADIGTARVYLAVVGMTLTIQTTTYNLLGDTLTRMFVSS
jgi:hypothetical protein